MRDLSSGSLRFVPEAAYNLPGMIPGAGLVAGGIPTWVLRSGAGADATWDADFANDRYWVDGQAYSSIAGFITAIGGTFTRSGSLATFVGSDGLIQTTPANDTPRRIFLPGDTQTPLGFLSEDTADNECLQSEDFTTTWSAINSDVPTTNNTDPKGGTTADEIACTSTADQQVAVHQSFTGLTAARKTALSCFLKAGTNATFVQLVWDTDGGAGDDGFFCNFNLSTGAKGTITTFTAGTAIIARIIDYGSGWFRCDIAGSIAVGTVGRFTIGIVDRIDAAGFEAADLTDNDSIIGWGAMIEIGEFGTDNFTTYIPTTTVAVTRAQEELVTTFADTPNVPFKNWSTTVGSVVIAWRPTALDATRTIWQIQDAGNDINESFRVNTQADGRSEFKVTSAGGTSTVAEGGTASFGVLLKVAVSWLVNDITLSVSGSAVKNDTSQAIPVVTRMFIGRRSQDFLHGESPIDRLTYFNVQLSDADLVTISTL